MEKQVEDTTIAAKLASVEGFFDLLPSLLEKLEKKFVDSLGGEVYRFDIAGVGSWLVDGREYPVPVIQVLPSTEYKEVTCTFSSNEETFLKVVKQPNKITSQYLLGRIKISSLIKAKKLGSAFSNLYASK